MNLTLIFGSIVSFFLGWYSYKLKHYFNNQQPKVVACQGGGETVVVHDHTVKSMETTTDDEFSNKSRNPPADNNGYVKAKEGLDKLKRCRP